jgi:ABC-type Zn uptake system ZnuABC Zn-binding protein ZnuA
MVSSTELRPCINNDPDVSMKRLLILIVLLMLGLYPASAQNLPLKVIATTTILADVAKNVGGDRVDVSSLVPPDADAHAFEPTPQDALSVSQADVVLAVGIGYEAFLAGLQENAARTDITVVSDGVTIYRFVADDEAMSPVEPLGILGQDDICGAHPGEATAEADVTALVECDPHVWTDPANAMIWADNIAEAFTAKDPVNTDTYRANADAYKKELQTADDEVRQILSVVPEEHRALVTNHEFMSYFARAYDFSVVGVVVPGGTSGGESDPQTIAALLDAVRAAGVPAIFAEASANLQMIEAIAQDAGVQVVTTLSESLTAADGAADTYLGYLRYNAQTVAEALKG